MTPDPSRPPSLRERGPWALVLAGGEGMRLRPFLRTVVGDDRPKQYVPLLGPRSLLRQTLDRAAFLVPPHRTVIVAQESHAGHLAAESLGQTTVLLQPANRDTALGILFPAHWISWRDPDATVVILPSDHFIGNEVAFMAHLAGVVAFVDRAPERLVLVGVPATEPEPEYGWIEPGVRLESAADTAVFEVRSFREKPTPEAARALLARGWLWNTFVCVAKVAALVAAGADVLPDLHHGLTIARTFAGSERERWAIRQLYAGTPSYNFSRSVLEVSPHLAVSKLPPVGWSDVGTPARLLKLLDAIGLRPSWMASRQESSGVAS